MNHDRAVHVLIEGQVQGVGFRRWVVDQAVQNGVRGWVRNRSSGEVEAVFCGTPQPVEAMVQACHGGPPRAHVRRVTQRAWEGPIADGFYQGQTL